LAFATFLVWRLRTGACGVGAYGFWRYRMPPVTTTKCLVLSTKRLVAAAKFLVAATKKLFIVPNFVAVTKPFFSVKCIQFNTAGEDMICFSNNKVDTRYNTFKQVRCCET